MRYIIQRGDTLWDLARKHGTTVDAIMRENPHIRDRNKIYAGQALNLPDPPSPQVSGIPSVGAPLEGLVRPPVFPEAKLTKNVPEYSTSNLVERDAQDAAQGMDPGVMDPTTLIGLGGPAMAGALVRAIPALARAMPAALPVAGKVAPTASNVIPIPGSVGAAKAMLAARPAADRAAAEASKSLQEAIQWYTNLGRNTTPADLKEAIQWYLGIVGQNAARNWGF